MADLYFIEDPHHDLSAYYVSITDLIKQGYLQDINLVNDSFWNAEDKPSWIFDMAYTWKNKVEFRKVTVECDGVPAIP